MAAETKKLDCLLFQVLIKCFGWEVLLSYFCGVISELLNFTGLLIFRELIRHVEEKTPEPTWYVYFLSLTMLVASWCQTIFYHQHFHIAMTSGMRIKTALMAAVYKKILFVKTKHQEKRGEIMLLNDCESVQNLMSYSSMVLSMPLKIFLATYLLWITVGLPALSGVGLFLLLVFLTGFLEYQLDQLNVKDVSLKNKITKMNTYTLNVCKNNTKNTTGTLMQREDNTWTKLAGIKALSIFINTSWPYVVCLATFATHYAIFPEQLLTAEKAFVTMAVFIYLQYPIEVIPEIVSATTKATASMIRIEEYLCREELDDSKYNKLDCDAVKIENGLLTWDPNNNFRLCIAKLEIPRGSLVAVVGPEGCGKTSFLSALLGEIECLQGHIQTSNAVAYVPQTAWIQHCSSQVNILFGARLNHDILHTILEACRLKDDWEIISYKPKIQNLEEIQKDNFKQTKCVNLSRDQQQKVSIARALYSNADLYLFDDPLCDVYPIDRKHIFKRVLSSNGILKEKMRILATSEVHWLPLVDLIIYIQDGNLLEMSSYKELMKKNENFAKFILSKLPKEQELNSEFEEDTEVKEIKKKMREHRELMVSQSNSSKLEEDVHKVKHNGLELMTCWIGSSPSFLKHATKGQNKLFSTASETGERIRIKNGELNAENPSFQVFQNSFRRVWSFSIMIIIVLFNLFQMFSLLADVKLAQWTGDPEIQTGNLTAPEVHLKHKRYLTEYAVLGVAEVLFVLAYATMEAIRMISNIYSKHASVLDKNMEKSDAAKAKYKNLLTQKLEKPEVKFPQIIFMWILCVFSVLVKLTVICIFVPKFVAIIVPLLFAYLAIQRFVVPASQELKRLEAASKLTIFSHFSETLAGCHVIRAFGAKNRFYQTCTKLIDQNNVFYFASIAANRWLGVWIEAVSSLVVYFTASLSLATHETDAASIGLFVVYAMQIKHYLCWLSRSHLEATSTKNRVLRSLGF